MADYLFMFIIYAYIVILHTYWRNYCEFTEIKDDYEQETYLYFLFRSADMQRAYLILYQTRNHKHLQIQTAK